MRSHFTGDRTETWRGRELTHDHIASSWQMWGVRGLFVLGLPSMVPLFLSILQIPHLSSGDEWFGRQ